MSEGSVVPGPWATTAGGIAPLPSGSASNGGYRDGWLEELKLDLFMVPGVDGAKLYPHKGQSIWLSPYGLSIEDQMALAKFATADVGDKGEEIERNFQATLMMLSRVVVGWNITDARGQPYPQPAGEGDVEAFKRLPARLIVHLIQVVNAGGESEGNASGA